MSTETLIEKIKVLNLEDGDILCLTTPGGLSDHAYENIKRSMLDALPQLRGRILILEEGLDIKVIRSAALKAELAEAERTL